jgi:rubrerythrin
MALKAADMFASGTDAADEDAVELVQTGSERLSDAVKELCDEVAVRDRLQRERDGWDLYYDVLDELERGLEEGDKFAETIRDKARELVEGWKL